MKIGWFAPWYRWCEYAAFGRALERRRFAYLDRLSTAHRILVLGEGDGRALSRLLTAAALAQIDVLELSGEMIALASHRVEGSTRVRFQQTDALAAAWPIGHYDGVVTLFFLDCFNEPEARLLICRLLAAMAPEALWLVTDFAIPRRGWRHYHAKLWIWAMYRFFALATGLRTRTLPPIGKLLTEAGMRRVEFQQERWGLIRSEVYVRDV